MILEPLPAVSMLFFQSITDKSCNIFSESGIFREETHNLRISLPLLLLMKNRVKELSSKHAAAVSANAEAAPADAPPLAVACCCCLLSTVPSATTNTAPDTRPPAHHQCISSPDGDINYHRHLTHFSPSSSRDLRTTTTIIINQSWPVVR